MALFSKYATSMWVDMSPEDDEAMLEEFKAESTKLINKWALRNASIIEKDAAASFLVQLGVVQITIQPDGQQGTSHKQVLIRQRGNRKTSPGHDKAIPSGKTSLRPSQVPRVKDIKKEQDININDDDDDDEGDDEGDIQHRKLIIAPDHGGEDDNQRPDSASVEERSLGSQPGTQYPCPDCNKVLSSTWALDLHRLQDCPNYVKPTQYFYNCDQCSMSFRFRFYMIKHLSNFHDMSPDEALDIVEDLKAPHRQIMTEEDKRLERRSWRGRGLKTSTRGRKPAYKMPRKYGTKSRFTKLRAHSDENATRRSRRLYVNLFARNKKPGEPRAPKSMYATGEQDLKTESDKEPLEDECRESPGIVSTQGDKMDEALAASSSKPQDQAASAGQGKADTEESPVSPNDAERGVEEKEIAEFISTLREKELEPRKGDQELKRERTQGDGAHVDSSLENQEEPLNLRMDNKESKTKLKDDPNQDYCETTEEETKENDEKVVEYLDVIDNEQSKRLRGRSVTCVFCHLEFATRKERAKHLEEVHGNCTRTRYKCSTCEKTFIGKRDYQTHILKHMDRAERKKYKCTVCHKIYVCEQSYRKHLKKHTGGLSCDICDKDYPTHKRLDRHMKSAHWKEVGHPCGVCGKMFFSYYIHIRHELTHSAEKNFKCDVCNKSYHREDLLKKHKSRSHIDSHCICDICGATLKTQASLKQHYVKIHTGIKSFPCDVCGKIFKREVMRDKHLKAHTSEPVVKPKHLCELCGASFTNKCNLRFHYTTAHCDERNYSCDICGMKFKLKQYCKNHIRKIHSNNPVKKRFKCEICSKEMQHNCQYVEHMKRHANIRNFICEACGKSFLTKGDLAQHKITHLKSKPYKCEVCARTFVDMRALRKHLAVEHDIILAKMRGRRAQNAEAAEGLGENYIRQLKDVIPSRIPATDPPLTSTHMPVPNSPPSPHSSSRNPPLPTTPMSTPVHHFTSHRISTTTPPPPPSRLSTTNPPPIPSRLLSANHPLSLIRDSATPYHRPNFNEAHIQGSFSAANSGQGSETSDGRVITQALLAMMHTEIPSTAQSHY